MPGFEPGTASVGSDRSSVFSPVDLALPIILRSRFHNQTENTIYHLLFRGWFL